MKRFLFVLLCLYMSLGCEEKPRPILNTERYLIDSAYLDRIDSVKALIDSLCYKMREERYKLILDSIIEERVAEIQKLQDP